MTAKPVFLHIGLPKTGTSFLQRMLAENRPRLIAQGTWVSGKPIFAHRLAVEVIDNPRRAGQADVAAIRQTSLDDARAELRRALGDPAIKRLIISSEYFFEANPDATRALFADLGCEDVHILAYLRRQDRLIESGYNQEVKAMGHRDPPRWPSYTPHLDWSAVLDAWSGAFGAENVIALGYDKAAASGSIAQRFFAAIGAGMPAGLSEPPRGVNESLPADLLEFKRLANSLGEKGLEPWLYRAMAAGPWGQKFHFDRDMAGRFLEIYGPSNERAVETYLGGDRSELALDEPLEEDRSGGNLVDALPIETVAKLLAVAVLDLMELRRSQEKTTEQLRQEIAALRSRA